MASEVLSLFVVVMCIYQVTSQIPPTPMAGAAGAGPGAAPTTATTGPQHPFCTATPVPNAPKIPIFNMDVRTGFYNGYRSNQSVIVEITAKYKDIWRIQQVFIKVPDDNPHLARRLGVGVPHTVGHWSWKMAPGSAYNNDEGSTKPVDCGGTSRYGPFGMLGLGAHAAMEMNEWPYITDKGYATIKALWVPPNDFENILHRRTITIEAYVTFDKHRPKLPTYHPPQPAISFTTFDQSHSTGQESRWVKLSATILSLDYIDMHNYMARYRPYVQMMQRLQGTLMA